MAKDKCETSVKSTKASKSAKKVSCDNHKLMFTEHKRQTTSRGQVQQVFIYMMVLIVVGAVIFIGFKSINSSINKACDVELASFKSNLRYDLEQNSRYGSIQMKDIKAPCSYEAVCFVNTTVGQLVQNTIQNEIIKNEIASGSPTQVFLTRAGITYPIKEASVTGIDVSTGIVCFNSTSGSFNYKLEGIGNGRVRVTQLEGIGNGRVPVTQLG